jgi:cellulose 1,4-beta-cellobiosidase
LSHHSWQHPSFAYFSSHILTLGLFFQCNCVGWQPSTNDKNAGIGNTGSCCAEMDIWEANSMNSAVTPHPCETYSQHSCSGDNCGGTYSSNRYAGDCDPDGCDYNPYRMGVTNFYGKGMTVDTSSKFTVVTQFIGSGTLTEIRQFFIQGGKKIPMPNSTWPTLTGYNSLTPDMCVAAKAEFGDTDYFTQRGGFTAFTTAVSKGMVLVMSLWDDVSHSTLCSCSVGDVVADK